MPATTTPNPSISLEFGDRPKGLLLPYVTSMNDVTGVVEGTPIFDSADKKVKYYNGSWKELNTRSNGTVDITPQSGKTDLPNAKVSIGTPTATPGILVLEDNNKAMVLPKVASPETVIDKPASGMIVYDPVKKLLCVFNGTEWAYWQAEKN